MSGGGNLSSWGIKNPVPAVMLFFVLCVAGLWGFHKLPVARFPDIAFPMTVVTIIQPGASPSQLETEVTRKVEDSVATVANVKRVTSTVVEGTSTTAIEFYLDTDLMTALNDTKDAVTRIRMDLPQDIQEPIVTKVEIGGALLTYSVSAPGMSEEELSWFVDRDVARAMYGVEGVAAVKRIGGLERQIRVDLDPQSLEAYGITAGEVSQQLALTQVERPGGKAEIGGDQQTIRTIGTVADAQQLRDYSIALPDGRAVRLSAIARITDGAADITQTALLDGKPVVGFALSRSRGADELDVRDDVQASLVKLKESHPGMEFHLVSDMTEETDISYTSSMTMLVEGALLALVVVFFFLRNWRATWISALALPLSIIPTFAVIYFLGFSLNMITLLALSVVVGILVDDAIVEIENIVRHLGMGKSPLQAASDAATEIGTAVIATSITLAAVFVPVAFMPGIAGKFFREFGWTAAAAVLFSLLVARLVTPMMAAHMLRPMPTHGGDSKMMRWYLKWADRALRHRGRTLWLALGLFVLSMAMVPLLNLNFIPPANNPQSTLVVELAPGASLQATAAVAAEARSLIADIPEIEHVFATVGATTGTGAGDLSSAELRRATLIIGWKDDRSRSQQQLETQVRQRLADIPGVRISFQGGEPGRALQLVLAGDDPASLARASREVERDIRQLPGLGTVNSSAALVRPEVIVRPDPARAADLGVSTADIAAATRVATRGDYEQYLSKLNLPERQVPIRVQLAEASLSDPALLGQLRVPSAHGGSVPLAAVAQIGTDSGPSQIDRFDRRRNVTITVDLNGRPMGEVDKQIKALPSLQKLPAGVALQPAGDSEIFEEMFAGFMMAMVAGLFCVYGVLLLLFNHASQPLTILVAVPLAAGGAFGALLLTGTDISLPVLIGLILLIGIAVKNSILLVDYAVIAERELGLSRHEALLDACHKRARPVLMTTLAMGAGMLPIAVGLGGDSSFRAPMAITVIGGLITSTVLSLVVVPAAFTLVDDIEAWVLRRLQRQPRAA